MKSAIQGGRGLDKPKIARFPRTFRINDHLHHIKGVAEAS